MNVIAFARLLPRQDGTWQSCELETMQRTFAAELATGEASEWQTASIPFSLFQRKVFDAATGGLNFTGGGPLAGERLCALIFSAPHSFDLTIDRIWITQGGAGVETFIPPL